ncbi:hypothetical protein K493DRAFT_410733 [Basidiobolus meristosporus CBS 931.73]|uniref:RRM domain-containing protein n=1 Tax=Basidiobolus meristosporus CBS 931.73 TaxID=1314790 RepID=A0A1Y1XTB0_9FUNG|nr:hypothetical protein K493DRAFT_410733 [Basidiobolus meristosporus CBS 931.73]|eukprot:ORX88935.1 hypothetical protein K493DRAFT_410733 [Basidiobolus meristosporus CBS 931.73]
MFRIASRQITAIRGYATKSVFVGNLSKKTKPEQLKELFSQHGTMEEAEAEKAVSSINGQSLNDRVLRVELSKN